MNPAKASSPPGLRLATSSFALAAAITECHVCPVAVHIESRNRRVIRGPGTGKEFPIPAGQAPEALRFDPNENLLIVVNQGSGDVVVRLYESVRATTRCTLRTLLPVRNAVVTDMLEQPVGESLGMADGAIPLEFRPFEVKTVRLQVGRGAVARPRA